MGMERRAEGGELIAKSKEQRAKGNQFGQPRANIPGRRVKASNK